MSEGNQRRLAAIVSVDVVGYSRLIGVDETGTLAALNAHRSELIDPLVIKHGGRIVKTMGDGLLLEFPSVVAAVECVIAAQEGMAERNAGMDADRAIQFRVGVHLGDVIVEGDDIFGDGVNVAARLEGLSETNGVALSDDAYRQVRDRMDADWEDSGEHSVKNISRPIQVWRWTTAEPKGIDHSADDREALKLPDKPSIAILPFENMSGDPEQEYFADGITEDIITALSKFRWFFVTARNSSFSYRGTATDVKQIGKELGVRYVLEGSVRKSGNRVRITAQLIEAENGNHIWAERYDRELADIFELQDEITLTIAAAVEPELAGSERSRALYKPTNDLKAWDFYQRGLAKLWQLDKENTAEGAGFMREAVSMDPRFGQAYAYLAFVDFWDVVLGWTEDRERTLRQGIANAQKAISIDQRDYIAHWALGRLHNANGNQQSAISELETSISINPNFVHAYHGLCTVHTHLGHPEKAIEYADMAIRLSPNDPLMWTFVAYKGMAYAILGKFEKAIELLEHACRYPTVQCLPPALLAAYYALVGRKEDAAASLAHARSLEPTLSLKVMQDFLVASDDTVFEKCYEGFRIAGLM